MPSHPRWLGNWVLKTRLVFGSGSWRSSCWVSAVVLGGFLRNFCVVPAGFGVKNLVFVKKPGFSLKPGFLELRQRSHARLRGGRCGAPRPALLIPAPPSPPHLRRQPGLPVWLVAMRMLFLFACACKHDPTMSLKHLN